MVSCPSSVLEEIRMSRKVRSIFALMALTLLLGSGAAHALPSAEGPCPERISGMLVAIWDWAASLFDAKTPSLSVFKAESGISMPTLPPAGSQSDGGAFIDPNGGS
jgi:hypothetical protein